LLVVVWRGQRLRAAVAELSRLTGHGLRGAVVHTQTVVKCTLCVTHFMHACVARMWTVPHDGVCCFQHCS
jgi:hypothetical protein